MDKPDYAIKRELTIDAASNIPTASATDSGGGMDAPKAGSSAASTSLAPPTATATTILAWALDAINHSVTELKHRHRRYLSANGATSKLNLEGAKPMKVSMNRYLFISLFMLFASSASAVDFAGEWSSNQGKMLLQQNGDHVTGTYAGKNGKIDGTVTGNKLAGTYTWTNKQGTFELNMGSDGNSFHGSWHRSSAHGTWTGTRLSGTANSKPKPSGQNSGGTRPGSSGRLTGISTPSGGSHSGDGNYEAICDGCGMKTVEMGSHRFCALTGVASGGFGSACHIRRDGNTWTLQATDGTNEAAIQSQRCYASCID